MWLLKIFYFISTVGKVTVKVFVYSLGFWSTPRSGTEKYFYAKVLLVKDNFRLLQWSGAFESGFITVTFSVWKIVIYWPRHMIFSHAAMCSTEKHLLCLYRAKQVDLGFLSLVGRYWLTNICRWFCTYIFSMKFLWLLYIIFDR